MKDVMWYRAIPALCSAETDPRARCANCVVAFRSDATANALYSIFPLISMYRSSVRTTLVGSKMTVQTDNDEPSLTWPPTISKTWDVGSDGFFDEFQFVPIFVGDLRLQVMQPLKVIECRILRFIGKQFLVNHFGKEGCCKDWILRVVFITVFV